MKTKFDSSLRSIFFLICGILAMHNSLAQWAGSGTTSGDIYRSGDVRIGANGNTFSGVKLQVENGDLLVNSASGSIDFRHFGTNDGWSFSTINAGQDIQLFSNYASGVDERRMVVRQNGNVGFNILPTTSFDFYNATASVNELRLQGGRSGGVFTPTRLSFWSDPRSSTTEWRPGYIQSLDNGNYTGGLAFFTNGSGSSQKTGAKEAMRVVNGRVGIGISSPVYALHVNGTGSTGIQYDGPSNGFAGLYANGGLPFYGYKQGNSIKAYHYVDNDQNLRFWLNGSEKMVLSGDGALGIGISSPERPIHLRGTNAIFRIDRDRKDPGFAIVRYTQGFGQVMKSFYFYTAAEGVNNGKFIIADWGTNVSGLSTTRMVIANNGNVGIGNYLNNNPSQKLTVSGNALANAYLTPSDKRYKKDIKVLPDAMSRLHQIRGVSYEYDTARFAERSLPTGKTYGFIAQELEKVFPELVVEDEEGFMAVNYDGLIPVLVEALKAQQERIETLETNLKMLASNPDKDILDPNRDFPAGAKIPQLYQNSPNPFQEKTTIRFFLPEGTQQATLYIFDMQGQQLKKIPIYQKGEGSLELEAGALRAGMYYYSLVANGKEIAMKRMMILD